MSEFENKDIDLLLSEYIDGTLSGRSETELKRLLLHDESINRKLTMLARQKRLLNALPDDKAPADTAERIKRRLERKLILDEYETAKAESSGAKHLLIRKIYTAAAMIALVSVMAIIIFNIIVPPEPAPREFTIEKPAVKPAIDRRKTTETVRMMEAEFVPTEPIYATLELHAEEVIQVTAFVEKAIFSLGLIDKTIPDRQVRSGTYRIQSDVISAGLLVQELSRIWDRFSETSFVIHSERVDDNVIIASATPDDVVMFFNTVTGSEHTEYAALVSVLKEAGGRSASGPVESSSALPPQPVKPVLTSPEAEQKTAEANPRVPRVNLTIRIVGL